MIGNVFHRRERCVGITLFRWGRKQLELWFCPAGHIHSHVHDHIDSVIILLHGRFHGRMGYAEQHRAGWLHRCKPYRIPAGVMHNATMISFSVFVNWETWIGEGRPKSAAEDFTAV